MYFKFFSGEENKATESIIYPKLNQVYRAHRTTLFWSKCN
jgi:hypothetical protein